MRLLTHGGTSYSERLRVGAWPDVPRHVLESTYGLPGEGLAYGLGMLDDGLPFLVARQRQITDTGRSYAFSLLLDPGRDVWTKFQWNAADFLRALLEDESCKRLLSEPESFTIEELTRLIENLTPAGAEAAPDPARSESGEPLTQQQTAAFLYSWIGAAFSDETVVAAPAAFGFQAPPDHAQLAKLLRLMRQPCFRAGSGWLVGGSREHGQALGARFVLDDGDAGAASPVSPLESAGREMIEARKVIASDAEFRKELEELHDVPCREWVGGAGASTRLAFERLTLLAQVLSTPPDESLFRTLDQNLQGPPFLASAVRLAAHRLALAGRERLPRAQTLFVLRNFLDHDLPLQEADIHRLHPRTVIEVGIEHETQAAGRALPLPPDWRAEIFLRRLGAAPDYAQVPKLLLQAHEFVVEHVFRERTRDDWTAEFVAAAEQQTKATSQSLHAWDGFPPEHDLWPAAAVILRAAARRRAQYRSRGWETEYLSFGDDPGGAALEKAGIGADDASRLVRRCLEEFQDGRPEQSARAADWLAHLADSPLRTMVSVVDKIDVAGAQVSDRWRPLLVLWLCYRGRASELSEDDISLRGALRPLERGREKVRAVLCGELSQMLREKPPDTALPDLKCIARQLGELPAELVAKLARLQPRHSGPRSFLSWLDGLLEIGAREGAAAEAVRFILESKFMLPDGWLFDGFDEKKLKDMAYDLLFGGRSVDNGFFRRRFEEVINTSRGDERLRKVFESVYKSGVADPNNAEGFLQRYAGHEDALERLFECFHYGMQRDVILRLAAYDEDAFAEAVQKFFEEAEQDAAPLSPYRHATLRHLRSPRGKKFKKSLTFWGRLSFKTDEVDQQLKKILERAGGREDAERDAWAEDSESRTDDDIDHDVDEDTSDGARSAAPEDTRDAGDSRTSRRASLKPVVDETKRAPGFWSKIKAGVKNIFNEPPPRAGGDYKADTPDRPGADARADSFDSASDDADDVPRFRRTQPPHPAERGRADTSAPAATDDAGESARRDTLDPHAPQAAKDDS